MRNVQLSLKTEQRQLTIALMKKTDKLRQQHTQTQADSISEGNTYTEVSADDRLHSVSPV